MELRSSFQLLAIIIITKLVRSTPNYPPYSYSYYSTEYNEEGEQQPEPDYFFLNDERDNDAEYENYEAPAKAYNGPYSSEEDDWRIGPAKGDLQSGRGVMEDIWSLITDFLISRGSPGLEPKSVDKIRYLVRRLGPNQNYNSASAWTSIARKGYKVEEKDWHMGGHLKVLIHGFTPGLPTEEINPVQKIAAEKLFAMGEAFSRKYLKCNIVIVDWTSISTYSYVKYYEAVHAVKYAAKDLAKFLIWLKDTRKLIGDFKDVHMIGFSLGAHVAGGAGRRVHKKGGVKIGRITGLDPAGPLFHEAGKLPGNKDNVLDSEDAQFVDVIHCNMGWETLSKDFRELRVAFGSYGTPAQCGHADFYPNGGISQQGCSYLQDKIGCSHGKCRNKFINSINWDYLACPCASWERFVAGECPCTIQTGGVYLGERVDKTARGRYYLY